MADLHTTLVAKVTAHLDLAQAATPGSWEKCYDEVEESNQVYAEAAWFEDGGHRFYGKRLITAAGESDLNEFDAEHIAANGPEHVIRVCQADLERLERHAPDEDGHCLDCSAERNLVAWPDCREWPPIAHVYGVGEDQ
jgi:hypothetical protein